jgi:4'-phosphopantetheinyl transferase
MQARPYEVRVLCCPATPSDELRALLRSSITADEEQRRARFYRPDDADRFLVGRGTLRRELGRMLALPPTAVPLELGPHGKPLVTGGAIEVNVSHSGGVVLIALAVGVEIGVDVERIDDRVARDAVLDRFFSEREAAEMRALPDELRVASFFHTWASREALIKAVGAGFSLPIDSFDVSIDPGRPPALVSARTPSLAGGPFTLVPIAVPPGHTAMLAVAAEAQAFRVAVVDENG